MTKTKNKNEYFTKIHEDAIILYCNTDLKSEKTKLYSELIQPAFNELVDKIVFTYKFNNLPNIDVLKDDCKVWLTTILDKYNPNRGSKAFSYFSVITKNWFIHQAKRITQSSRREIDIEDYVYDSDNENLSVENEYETEREKREFWGALIIFIRQMQEDDEVVKTDGDRKILSSIEYMLENMDKLEILNKKAIYLYLREMTGLSTKQLAPTLRKVKTEYVLFKNEWNS